MSLTLSAGVAPPSTALCLRDSSTHMSPAPQEHSGGRAGEDRPRALAARGWGRASLLLDGVVMGRRASGHTFLQGPP